MPNAVEVVARAICKSFYINGGNADDDGWDECTDEIKAEYIKAAHAAIKAFRASERSGFKLD